MGWKSSLPEGKHRNVGSFVSCLQGLRVMDWEKSNPTCDIPVVSGIMESSGRGPHTAAARHVYTGYEGYSFLWQNHQS